jgi:biopolymer transport protein ExbD
MRFEKPRQIETEERMLPLINIVFLLLIFFMVAGGLVVMEPFEVKVPKSSSGGGQAAEPMVLLLSADGRMALDGQVMAEALVMDKIKQQFLHKPQTKLHLKADANLPGNRVVQLLEILNQAGVQQLRLLTLPLD